MNIKDSPDVFKVYLVKVDMRLLRHFADYILENSEEDYASLSPNIKMALKIALVICYTRPFFENYEMVLDNETKITDYLIKDFLDEEKVIHKNILKMHMKEVGDANIPIPDLKNIESNIVHISLSKSDSEPLDFKIVKSLRKMAKKIFSTAEKLVDDAQDIDQEFCFRGVDLQR